MATYVSNVTVTAAVAAGQSMTGVNALPSFWTVVISDANTEAYGKLRSVMRGRGFTTTQIDQWDDRASWNKRLAVAIANENVSFASEDRGEAFRLKYEALLEELMAADLTIDGIVINPTSAATRIAYGEFTTSTDIHTIDDEL